MQQHKTGILHEFVNNIGYVIHTQDIIVIKLIFMSIVVLWALTPCLEGVCQIFGVNYGPHLSGKSEYGGEAFIRNVDNHIK